jgi:hypothetical protein
MIATPSDTPTALETRRSDAARLMSPSTARNREAIAAVLAPVLPSGGRVLEIGSGTGEHAVTLCAARPDILWQPSDPDARSRESQNAWAVDTAGRMLPSVELDLLQPDWTDQVQTPDAVVCINVIHISPWAVAENLARGAARLLKPGQPVFLYGPYKRGADTAPSNLEFDQSLKSRNPTWGVRELDDVMALFDAAGFDLARQEAMPANNLSLVFIKRDAD